MAKLTDIWDGKPGSGKFRSDDWISKECYCIPHFTDSEGDTHGVDESNIYVYIHRNNSEVWHPYQAPPKLITWYRPRVVWFYKQERPAFHAKSSDNGAIDNDYFKTKDLENWFSGTVRVIEWDEIEAPETFEGVTGDQ